MLHHVTHATPAAPWVLAIVDIVVAVEPTSSVSNVNNTQRLLHREFNDPYRKERVRRWYDDEFKLGIH